MAVATTKQYWNSRLVGASPASADKNVGDTWSLASGSAGSASNGAWVITNGTWNIGADASSTVFCMLSVNSVPNNDEVLLSLKNGSHKLEVKSTGALTSLKLVGATTVTISDLDLSMAEDNAVPLTLRLTLDASGNGNLYIHEIINNADGDVGYYSVTGASDSGTGATFGTTSGSVSFHAVYYSKFGAFNPEELMLSGFAQDTIARMGLSLVEGLKQSARPYLKTYVDDSSIIYGYDISSEMLNRISVPSVHVVLNNINSPEFSSLGGSSIDQYYDANIYVTTKGTNYEDAYRLGINIIGEIFDELYTTTGILATTDNLESYNMELDSKMDDDETICVHHLILTYRRRIKMTHR